jgi:hypothetical protein
VPRWEVPEITLLQVVDETATLRVQRGDTNTAFQDIRPLGLFVPVELADDAFIETHVYTSQFDTDWQFPDGGLSRPSALLCFC